MLKHSDYTGVEHFTAVYNNVMVSCMITINSVLRNSTDLYKFILVRHQIIVPRGKIPTQQLAHLLMGSVKHVTAYSQELGCDRVPYCRVQ